MRKSITTLLVIVAACLSVPIPTKSAQGCCSTESKWIATGQCIVFEAPTCFDDPEDPCQAEWQSTCNFVGECEEETCGTSNDPILVQPHSTRCDGCTCVPSAIPGDMLEMHPAECQAA